MHEAHEAAGAVAAMLDLAAVGIENAVAEIGVRLGGALDQQDLVGADAECRSPSARARSGVISMVWRTPSRTTKSLPAPCILVKFQFMAGLSPIPGARAGGRPQ